MVQTTLPGLNSISDFKWLSQASQSGKMKNMETRKWFSFPEAIFVWLQSIQTVVNWSPGSTRRWFGSDCLATRSSLATPGTVARQNQHQLARLAEPQVAVQAIHWRHLGPLPPSHHLPRCLCCPVSLPAITDAGQLVGRAGTSRLATYTTGAGHLYHQALATYQGPGSGYPGAVSQFHHAPFQLTSF